MPFHKMQTSFLCHLFGALLSREKPVLLSMGGRWVGIAQLHGCELFGLVDGVAVGGALGGSCALACSLGAVDCGGTVLWG